MSKTGQTRNRGAKENPSQGNLDTFLFLPSLPVDSGSPAPPIYVPSRSPSPEPCGQELLPPLSCLPFPPPLERTQKSLSPIPNEADNLDDDSDDELDELIHHDSRSCVTEIRSWPVLRNEIDGILHKQKNRATLPLNQINQLQLIRNFATLRIKGFKRTSASVHLALSHHDGDGVYFARRVRALARHYQMYEQLPIDRRGGKRIGSSHLDDEDVEREAHSWLDSQKVGSVTSSNFCRALNTSIFPQLGIALKQPLSNRTARRWLHKLGFRHKTLTKGVYMDGHERADVVAYRENVFLPAMEKFERRMAQYHGPELKHCEPNLQPGEKRVIAQFHDESCFHANEFKRSAWCVLGSMVLQKKSRGRLIHVSDFINEEDGRLVQQNEQGQIVRDARKIIYPGAAGDPWWDTKQLLTQVTNAIDIFNVTHPDCEALFIFDQSSAHASLGPDALRPFDMNKGNGGKQRKQKDTIIPNDNPTISLRGTVQRMTTESGEAKGLQTVLEERGFDTKGIRAKCSPVCPFENEKCCLARIFNRQEDVINQVSMLEELITKAGHHCIFLPKFHCELNPIEMYWGYAKYRYRGVFKNTFADAKAAVLSSLQSCPLDTLRHFINRTWRFMSAYRQGLRGKAAEWAVKKQRSHRTVSRRAMLAIESILN
ncbi:hypothetical protein BS47DRAFT_1292541 [Hydnum rufescens UP504]|uniref:Uncharacterized protein n=1 Tax=Hydnum rufescens UP504 TaxID=1448309 RepID=A0A9P6B4R7_9AGAM|nr:hypothetical protein BS47DRAFT_1292541 [Hydnum rufescens UP504]